MNKKELIDAVSAASHYPKKDIETIINAAIACMSHTLSKGEAISLPGFATLAIKERAARAGRNPRSGETIQIAASKTVQIKPSSVLKEAINKT